MQTLQLVPRVECRMNYRICQENKDTCCWYGPETIVVKCSFDWLRLIDLLCWDQVVPVLNAKFSERAPSVTLIPIPYPHFSPLLDSPRCQWDNGREGKPPSHCHVKEGEGLGEAWLLPDDQVKRPFAILTMVLWIFMSFCLINITEPYDPCFSDTGSGISQLITWSSLICSQKTPLEKDLDYIRLIYYNNGKVY